MICQNCNYENKFDAKYCGNCSAELKLQNTPSMVLFSNHYHSGEKNKLLAETVSESLGRFSKVSMAFAYYDSKFCINLLFNSTIQRGNSEIRIIFNGLKGSRLESQWNDLISLKIKLEKRFHKVSIKLFFEKGIFHSKLILAQDQNVGLVFVGSANLTNAAYSINEEIFLQIKGQVTQFSDYFERIWTSSEAIDILDMKPEEDEVVPADSLVNFFRAGSLFFKPNSLLQFGFNPFSEFLNSLSDLEKQKLGSVPLPFSEGTTGVGSFNIKRAMGFSDNAIVDNEKKQSRFSIKPYSIETCLGFWVPDAFRYELIEKLDEVGQHKQGYYEKLRARLKSIAENEIERNYSKYCDRAFEEFLKKEISFTQFFRNKYCWQIENEYEQIKEAKKKQQEFLITFKHEVSNRFQTFFDRFKQDLANDDLIKRICSPYVEGILPEIWDDYDAYDEFKTSFFEYLEFLSTKIESKIGKVPGIIFYRLEIDSEITKDEIEDKLKRYIEEEKWGIDDW